MLPGLSQAESFQVGGQRIFYHPDFIEPLQADQLFRTLLQGAEWAQPEVVIHGRTCRVPRLVAWEGEQGISYSYSGLRHECRGWRPELARLKGQLQELCGRDFNFALLNLYRDGQDQMGWHADNETELGPDPLVASISLGAERDFRLRPGPRGASQCIPLEHGSLLLMPGSIYHQLPARRGLDRPRINISFRQVRT